MVEPILYASLGALVATLLALLFLPLFWRRAVRLTTKQLIHRLPISASEIVAAQDRLRAEQAMAMRIVERKAEKALSDATQDRVDSARARATELGHLADLADLRGKVAALEAEGARVKGELDRSGGEAASAYEALKQARGAAEQAARDLQAARQDASAARSATDQARIEAAARESEIAALRARLAAPASVAAPSQPPSSARQPAADFGKLAQAVAGDHARPFAATQGDGLPAYEDAALAALREKLDEVADAIVRAAGATDNATAGAPARTPAAKPREKRTTVAPVKLAERAGA